MCRYEVWMQIACSMCTFTHNAFPPGMTNPRRSSTPSADEGGHHVHHVLPGLERSVGEQRRLCSRLQRRRRRWLHARRRQLRLLQRRPRLVHEHPTLLQLVRRLQRVLRESLVQAHARQAGQAGSRRQRRLRGEQLHRSDVWGRERRVCTAEERYWLRLHRRRSSREYDVVS